MTKLLSDSSRRNRNDSRHGSGAEGGFEMSEDTARLIEKLEADKAAGVHQIIKNEISCSCGFVSKSYREWVVHAHGEDVAEGLEKRISKYGNGAKPR